MSDVTQLLDAAAAGDSRAAAKLLPLVYDELRKLAASRLADEKPGQTLQPTALVHEAYVRLVGGPVRDWDGRGHFFAAAAEAMRRILVEAARRKNAAKRGGLLARKELNEEQIAAPEPDADLVALDEALKKLATIDREAAQAVEVVNLHYFAGLTWPAVAKDLGISERTARNRWSYARAWLLREMKGGA